jgi:spermidine/putrescine transport system permease protein
MDLGANEWTTFWKVTFPLILPGILAAALLAFSLSIDDYVITSFTAGRTSTFPIFIWGAARIGVPVQVNVIGTALFLIAVGFVVVTTFFQGRASRPPKAEPRPDAAATPATDRALAPAAEA